MDFGELGDVIVDSSVVTNAAPLVGKPANGGGYACVRAEGIWEIYVPSSQVFFFLLVFSRFYWSIVDLQCCVSVR